MIVIKQKLTVFYILFLYFMINMKRDNYSTLIEDLPEIKTSEENFEEDILSIDSYKDSSDSSSSLIYDGIFLFLLTMFITNKQFIRWISQFNILQSSKNNIMFSALLSTISSLLYIIYKFISDI